MPNSSRTPQPGDSSVDLSELSENEETPPWMPPPSDSAVEFGTDHPVDEDVTPPYGSGPGSAAEFEAGAAGDSSESAPNSGDAGNENATPDVPEAAALPEGKPDGSSDTVVGFPEFESPSDETTNRPEGPTSSTSGPSRQSGTTDLEPKAAAGIQPKADGKQNPIDRNSRQRLLLILLASYASAVTLAFVWLLLNRQSAAPHELESLPDVAPLGPNEFRYVPEHASMPPGHTLPLGGEGRLGHIRVQPLRVTRGPIEFTHYADGTQERPATEPVLKLWLRFTNVSADQLIAPLDRPLLFQRKFDDLGEPELANQLVLPAERTDSGGPQAFVLDHPESSEWDLKGQRLGYRLKPGESIDTYIPTNPGDDRDLTGKLLWRVHLRKGYHAHTGHGVTTIIEVPFHIDDVRDEPATS